MRVCVIEPPYSADYADGPKNFEKILSLMEEVEKADLVVLPESCTQPAFAQDLSTEFLPAMERYEERMFSAAKKLAVRLSAVVFYGGYRKEGNVIFNRTVCIGRNGEFLGEYHKQHMTPGEIVKYGHADGKGYEYEYEEPFILTYEGIRYAFLTCYDFYFYEYFPQIARMEPDIIIGCSHQRTDTHDALDLLTRHAAYETNATVIRASVSMGEDSPLGGCSMVVLPDGKKAVDLLSHVGIGYADIDPHAKYLKPAGFKGKEMPHWQYIEKGRRPWKYRPAGPSVTVNDEFLAYPRVCAHRGFNTVAPENSMPAYGAAVAMGADEIEFDLWPTSDDVIVSTHDKRLERVSDGDGLVYEHTYEELLRYDFGFKRGEEFRGLRILTFEQILRKLAGQVIMNIHVKDISGVPYEQKHLDEIVRLIRKYDCEKTVYFMTSRKDLQEMMAKTAPGIARCMGAGHERFEIVDNAIALGCKKVQLWYPDFTQEMIDKAHAAGIRCNVFYADDADRVRECLSMGVDTILTNDYGRVAQVVRDYQREHGHA